MDGAVQARLRGDLVPRFWEAVSSSGDDGTGSNLGPVLASSLEVRRYGSS